MSEFTVIGGIPPLLPEGSYQLAYLGNRTIAGFAGSKSNTRGHKAGKLRIDFRVVDVGEYFDVEVPTFFNVLVPMQASFGRNGAFALVPNSSFLRAYLKLFGRVKRRDRLSLRRFKNVVIEASVRTVKQDRNQKPLAESCHYSVVDELIQVVAGS
ncbi:MAG: hypothetical protein KJ040_00085 [Gammaproteobacteria bacterium]|nr:hypothetical protein [Gammaproteobacteria bacterium]